MKPALPANSIQQSFVLVLILIAGLEQTPAQGFNFQGWVYPPIEKSEKVSHVKGCGLIMRPISRWVERVCKVPIRLEAPFAG